MNFSDIASESAIILALIAVNGILAMAEMAIVSARKTRLQQLADEGHHGAQTALDLAMEPSSFLASVQVGITLIGIFAGAFGGATITEELARYLDMVPSVANYSHPIALGTVVVTVTFLSLLLGELVPKRIGISHAERVASALARPIQLISVIARPVVHFLSLATDGILKMTGITSPKEPPVTEEEVKILIDQGAEAGVFEKDEGTMMKRALAFSDLSAADLMTQRMQLVTLDIDAPFSVNMAKILAAPHSYFPVYEGSADHFIGVIPSKGILERIVREGSLAVDLRKCVAEPLFIAESLPTLKLLDQFRRTGKHMALVVDEYGTPAGMVTLTDLMEAIVGDIPRESDDQEASYFRRDDGSLLVDGIVSIAELMELLEITNPNEHPEGDYRTLGGFVMDELGRIPRAGDKFRWRTFSFEVVDMDGRRVDKVLIAAATDPVQ